MCEDVVLEAVLCGWCVSWSCLWMLCRRELFESTSDHRSTLRHLLRRKQWLLRHEMNFLHVQVGSPAREKPLLKSPRDLIP